MHNLGHMFSTYNKKAKYKLSLQDNETKEIHKKLEYIITD